MVDRHFSKTFRLLRPREFKRVFDGRCSEADGMIVVYGSVNELDHPRLGLVVSQKVGRAVIRNRWKRMLREAFRLSRQDLPPMDLVCIPRPRAEPDVHRLIGSLTTLAAAIQRRIDRRESTAHDGGS